MAPVCVIDGLIGSMEELDPAREKSVVDLAKGPLPAAVKALERLSGQLPTDQDFHFYSNFKEFKGPVARLQGRVVSLLSDLGSLKGVCTRPAAFPADLDEDYDWLVGVQDALVERVDASLEKFYAERKADNAQKLEMNAYEAASKQRLSRNASHSSTSEDIKSKDVKVARNKEKLSVRSPIPFHIPSIPRPQDRFDDAVDNSYTPFKHKFLKGRNQQSSQGSVSHETVPTSGDSPAISTPSVLELHARKLGVKSSSEIIHPLEEELTKMAYVEGLSDTIEIRKYESLDCTPCTLVTSRKSLKEMAVKLRMAGEIAVDLENHHYRSYQGFVCLMQVSTRDEDFIIDTLDLRSQIGPCLGDIFSDPTIKKVMHGADRDIVWLQRDFGIYVCNLFDTGQAARVLQLQGFGLAFLLDKFCGVLADKRYQLADWRIRPLPAEMIKYAREDTHYLLYVYDMLRQLLLDGRVEEKIGEDDPFLQVYKRSRDICLQLYAKDLFTETSYQQLYGLHEKKFRPEQLAVLAVLYSWRDQIARKEDESTGYVLPNHLLLQLASEMPETVRHLQSFVRGSHSFVSRNASAVVEIIRQAKEKALRDKDLHSEQDKQRASHLEEEVADEEEGEISKIEHKAEGILLSNTLQTENLVTSSEASSTLERMAGSDSCAAETTASEKATLLMPVTTAAVPAVMLGEGLSKLSTEILAAPVVVSRKMSSSFFNSRPGKTVSVPHPSSNLSTPEELGETFEHRPAAPLGGQSLIIGNHPCRVGQGMPEVFSGEHSECRTLVEGQGSDQAQNRMVSEKFLTSGSEVTSSTNQTAIAVSSAMEGAVDNLRDGPFTVPEFSTPQGPLKSGDYSEIQGKPVLVNNSTITASVEYQTGTENAMLVQSKRKPSKLGALLGGRSRVQQFGPRRSAKDFEQEQARLKTQDIESSMVLPFGGPVELLFDIPTTSVQHPVTEVNFDGLNKKVVEEPSLPSDKETQERPACSPASSWQDVIMLDADADEASLRTGSAGILNPHDRDEPRKHRAWWPPLEDSPGMVIGRVSTSSARGLTSTTLDGQSDNPDGDRNYFQVPPSLSEIRRNSKRRETAGNDSEPPDINNIPEVPASVGSRGPKSRIKRRRREKSSTSEDDPRGKASTENILEIRNFNYREARNALGLDNMYSDKADDRQGTSNRGSRGRGSRKDSSKPGIPFSKSAFDPLRRVREEPRPEGIKPGQRRQVFPQSGNRTAVFKK